MHTHCAPRIAGDPFGVAAVMRGTPVGKNMVTNFRGMPMVAYGDMLDFDLQESYGTTQNYDGGSNTRH
jgi:hypothetical protein